MSRWQQGVWRALSSAGGALGVAWLVWGLAAGCSKTEDAAGCASAGCACERDRDCGEGLSCELDRCGGSDAGVSGDASVAEPDASAPSEAEGDAGGASDAAVGQSLTVRIGSTRPPVAEAAVVLDALLSGQRQLTTDTDGAGDILVARPAAESLDGATLYVLRVGGGRDNAVGGSDAGVARYEAVASGAELRGGEVHVTYLSAVVYLLLLDELEREGSSLLDDEGNPEPDAVGVYLDKLGAALLKSDIDGDDDVDYGDVLAFEPADSARTAVISGAALTVRVSLNDGATTLAQALADGQPATVAQVVSELIADDPSGAGLGVLLGRPDADGGLPDGGAAPAAVPDPAPQATGPGVYSCDGCPQVDVDGFEFEESNSSHTFSGVAAGAVGDGEYYVEGAGGEAIGGPIATSDVGVFSSTVPLFCGLQLVKNVWSNDVGSTAVVFAVTRTDCVDADIQLTLAWDDLGRDYELHLIREGGVINDDSSDCTWTSCLGTGPDWGTLDDAADNPHKDVDNTGGYGPENIYLSGPEPGIYTVMVEHWGSGSPDSDGQLTFNVKGVTTVADVTGLPPQYVWNVGTIEWPSGEVTLAGELIDCTGSWSSGCQLTLP